MVKVYIPVLPKSLKVSTNILTVCGWIHHYCSIFWKVFLKFKKEGKHSKIANFAVTKICVLRRVTILYFYAVLS